MALECHRKKIISRKIDSKERAKVFGGSELRISRITCLFQLATTLRVHKKTGFSPGLFEHTTKRTLNRFCFDAAPQTRARQPHTV
jgi:hypothetical protein